MFELPLTDLALTFLAQPNPAVIATVRPDGQPVSVATWYLLATGRVLVNMEAGRRRLTYLRQDPRVSITVLGNDTWYTHVTLLGRVVDIADDPDLQGIDRLAKHYTGHPFQDRHSRRVNAWVEIDRWTSWELDRESES